VKASQPLCLARGVAYLCCIAIAMVIRIPVASPAAAQTRPQVQRPNNPEAPCRIIYVGIVGALETSNNEHSGLVQIRDLLRGPAYSDVCARSFTPYTWKSSLRWLLQHFPSHPGRLTDEELKRAPKVILVGHSAGGWAVLSVARNLSRKGIPVELTIQVDSVGITDRTVPKNVKTAAIFHARDILMFLTTKRIKAEDPSKTKLGANILVKGAGHESVTRDPRIRELVMDIVESLRAASAPSVLPIPESQGRGVPMDSHPANPPQLYH
jgi:hypothetical protein